MPVTYINKREDFASFNLVEGSLASIGNWSSLDMEENHVFDAPNI